MLPRDYLMELASQWDRFEHRFASWTKAMIERLIERDEEIEARLKALEDAARKSDGS